MNARCSSSSIDIRMNGINSVRRKSVRKKRGQDLSGICKIEALSEAVEVLSPFFPNALNVVVAARANRAALRGGKVSFHCH